MPTEVETRWLTTAEQRVWRGYLLASAQLTELLDADLRQYGLDLAEYEILVALAESPGRQLRMSELAEAVHQSRSRLTHTVSRMENQDLVERVSCPSDRRGVWAQLSDQGQALLEAVAPRHVDRVREHFVDPVSDADLAALGRAYEAMLAAMDATRTAGQAAPSAGHRP